MGGTTPIQDNYQDGCSDGRFDSCQRQGWVYLWDVRQSHRGPIRNCLKMLFWRKPYHAYTMTRRKASVRQEERRQSGRAVVGEWKGEDFWGSLEAFRNYWSRHSKICAWELF